MAQTVPDGAGILVPPGNFVELSRALQRFLEDPNLRNQLSTQAALARTQLRSWESAAAELSAVLRSIDVASIKTLNA
jgi:glycosyltransferase involved in cell wall biosynthesis